jgi:hypothetical protein
MHTAEVAFDFAEVMERVRRVIREIEPHDSVANATRSSASNVSRAKRRRSRPPGTVDVKTATTACATPERARHRDRGRRAPVRAADSKASSRGRLPDVRHRSGRTATHFRGACSCWAAGPSAANSTQAFARLRFARHARASTGPRMHGREEDDDVSELACMRTLPRGRHRCAHRPSRGALRHRRR